MAYANPEPDNRVELDFHTSWLYGLPGNTFTNHEVTGAKKWNANMDNSADETGESVTGLTLRLNSDLVFENFKRESLIKTGPPTYEWSLGDFPEGVILASFVLGFIHTVVTTLVSANMGFMAGAIFMLVLLAVRPRGFFGIVEA